MNERLKEIEKQSYFLFKDEYALECQVFSKEKFAKLIVAECVKIVENNNPCPPGTTIMYSMIQDEYFDKGWQAAAETKSYQIKKHFYGVEE